MTSNDKECKVVKSDYAVLEVIDPDSIPKSIEQRREWIKYMLKIRRISFGDLARKHGISRQCYSIALHQAYPSCEHHIAQALNIRPDDLWPERYENGLPKKNKNHGKNYENQNS